MSKKGFTLIELLAVIIILGILMLIAIPSVTSYINNSRKNTYIDTANEIIKGVSIMVNNGDFEISDTDTTYYIPISAVSTENTLSSPYGNFEEGYVLVTYDGDSYDYYIIARDESNYGIDTPKGIDSIDKDDIKSDVTSLSTNIGIDGKSKITIFNEDGMVSSNSEAEKYVDGNTGNIVPVIYPAGKDKSTVVTGDIVKMGKEEFYVIGHDGNDLILLSKYNLKVGSNYENMTPTSGTNHPIPTSEERYGLQDDEMRGVVSGDYYYKGVIAFSNGHYWSDKVGEGLQYSGSYSSPNYPYVYDDNTIIKQYVDNYSNYLKEHGVDVKEARIMTYNEAIGLGCIFYYSYNCENAPEFVSETSYWLGNALDNDYSIFYITTSKRMSWNAYSSNTYYGIRPVIVI